MQVEARRADEAGGDVLVVPVAEGGEPPAGADSRVAELIASGEAGTGFGETAPVGENGTRLVVAGLGRRADADSIRTAVGGAANEARRVGGTLAYLVDPALPVSAADQARAAADGLVLSTYDTRQWRSRKPDDRKPFERLVLVGADDGAV